MKQQSPRVVVIQGSSSEWHTGPALLLETSQTDEGRQAGDVTATDVKAQIDLQLQPTAPEVHCVAAATDATVAAATQRTLDGPDSSPGTHTDSIAVTVAEAQVAGVEPSKTTNTPLTVTVHPQAPAEAADAVGSGVPSTPLTLDDIWPAVLTSSHRTNSANSGDALMDLYNQYMRQGSGSFSQVRRQDSILSGGLGGVLHPSGGSRSLLQTPKLLATLHSLANTPKGFGPGYNSTSTPGINNTPKGLLRLQSFTSQGAGGGLSPGFMSLMSGPFRTFSLEKGPGGCQDWLSWPPTSSMAVQPLAADAHLQHQLQPQNTTQNQQLAGVAASDDQQHQQQRMTLAAAPSVTGWLPLDPGCAAGYNPQQQQQQQQQQQGTHISSSGPPEAPVLIHGAAAGNPAQSLIQTGACLLHDSAVQPSIQRAGLLAAVQGPPAGVADTDAPSDEPEQHPYTFMEPAAAAAAATAARQHRKKVLAELRRKQRQAPPRRRAVRKQGAKDTLQLAPILPGYHAAPGDLTLQAAGQANAISAEERRSLAKAARIAMLARQRDEQFLQQQQQQQQQHCRAPDMTVLLPAHQAAAAGASGTLQQGPPPADQQHGVLLQQCNDAATRPTHQHLTAYGYGGMSVAGPAAAAVESSDYSSSDSSGDESSDISSDDSDLPGAAAAQLEGAAAARASGRYSKQVQTNHSLYYNQQRQHSWPENMATATPAHLLPDGFGLEPFSGTNAAAAPPGQHRQQHAGEQRHSLRALPGASVEHQLLHNSGHLNSHRVSSPGMQPLLVPVAATGRHGSGASDHTALDHQKWAAGGNLGTGMISRHQSGGSSTHGSPNQPLQPQQQQQYIVSDSYRRVVIDPQSSTVTVYPRTKRGRKLIHASAAAQHQPSQQQQPQQHHGLGQTQQPLTEAAVDLCSRGGARLSVAGSKQQQQQQQPQHMPLGENTKSQQQQQQQQQTANLVSGNTIALNRPRRRIRPTAAAVAYLADSDCEMQQSLVTGLANNSTDAAGLAVEEESADVSASDMDVSESDGSASDLSSDLDDYQPGSKRSKIRRQASTTAITAAPAKATKRRRGSGAGGPEASQPAASASQRRAAAGPRNSSSSGKKSPDFSLGSGAAAKPVIEDTRSKYRGVTRHRRSGRWEAHIWVKELGRQVYLGGYELEEAAAEAYDMAALKCKGQGCPTNFPYERYADLLESLGSMTLEELIMAVRRQSQGFSRGSSNYRGVTAHPSGRWESRIGIPGSRHVYLGLFVEEQEAARAYDGALVRLKGTAAATNYSLGSYQQQLAEHYQMKMAVEEGLVHRELFKRHSGQDFEQWIKLGLSAFDIQLTTKAKDMARADVGNAGEAGTASGSAVIRLGSGRVSGDGGDSNGESPPTGPAVAATPAADVSSI